VPPRLGASLEGSMNPGNNVTKPPAKTIKRGSGEPENRADATVGAAQSTAYQGPKAS